MILHILSFLTGVTLVKFIIKTAWNILLAAITCFMMMQYFIPAIVSDFSAQTANHIEKKFHNKVNDIKEKPSAKKIMKKWKNLKDRMSK